jgi:nucleoside-diphosphate-sugar epimerase
MTARRVLVTGATGFVGRQAVAALKARQWEVHAAAVGQPLAEPGVRWHASDLLVPGEAARLVATARPTHLLHLAWYAEPGRYWTSPLNGDWVQASIDLVRAFLDGGGRRVVGVGSCAEYDWQSGHCDEARTPLVPATLYGAAKRAAGLMLEAMAAQAGIPGAWARLFFLYGPHEHPNRLVSSVVRALLAGRVAECSEGSQVRDFLDVEDAGDALAALVASEVTGGVNVASGRPVAVRDLVLRLGELAGRPDLVRLGARPADPVAQLTAATERLNLQVGWSPRSTLDESLARTVEWWKASRTAGPGGDAA